jgi:drug/metabolite transporter (DMT)-like permease
VFLGWLLASEPLTMRVVLASVAILGAILLIRRGERRAVVAPMVNPKSAAVHASEECA